LLYERGANATMILYVAGSVVLSIVAVFVGLALMRSNLG
jgi:fluoride ion exporter CrcB/FEX